MGYLVYLMNIDFAMCRDLILVILGLMGFYLNQYIKTPRVMVPILILKREPIEHSGIQTLEGHKPNQDYALYGIINLLRPRHDQDPQSIYNLRLKFLQGSPIIDHDESSNQLSNKMILNIVLKLPKKAIMQTSYLKTISEIKDHFRKHQKDASLNLRTTNFQKEYQK